MAEYIEREALLKRLCNDDPANMEDYYYNAIKEAPTADVVEVRHGEWVEDGYYDNPCVCSNCGAEANYISRFKETFDYDWKKNLQPTGYEEYKEYIETPYCPNCGAKMDGKIPTKEIDKSNRCVSCGAEIPEGTWTCPSCDRRWG